MLSIQFNTFTDVRRTLADRILQAPEVKTERWQGVDVSKNPAATTFELRNVCFEVPLFSIEDLQHWRTDTMANIPWADDHFLERVGGLPLNPGVQWANWPWASSADKHRSQKEELGPLFPPQDWSYLAGLIDGDGTVYFQKHKPSFQGVVRVYQKNRAVLDELHALFKVGDVRETDRDTEQNLNGKTYQNEMHQWQVGSILEIKWLLNGVLPYLRIKKQAALAALFAIETSLKKREGLNEIGAPLKKVWGRDWPQRFNHSYMSRLWPKTLDGGGSNWRGHIWQYGDLQDLVDLLVREPYTRQAWIPLFFPEDTGYGDGGRKPCTLGYQILVRDDDSGPKAHVWYPLRSCDLVRHFPDDCYLAVRLLLWIVQECRKRNPFWNGVELGSYAMHMTSLHIFANDKRALGSVR